jgi:hypothetical protein
VLLRWLLCGLMVAGSAVAPELRGAQLVMRDAGAPVCGAHARRAGVERRRAGGWRDRVPVIEDMQVANAAAQRN